jgi:hypothetical protein
MQPIKANIIKIFQNLRHNLNTEDLQQIQCKITNVIMENAKLAKRTQCRILIGEMIRRDLFFGDVKSIEQKMRRGGGQDREIMRKLMRKKEEDAKKEERMTRREYRRLKKEVEKAIKNRKEMLRRFRGTQKREGKIEWERVKKKRIRRIEMEEKSEGERRRGEVNVRRNNEEEGLGGIKYRDEDLKKSEQIENVNRYGEVGEFNEIEEEMLKLGPKHRIHDKIEMENLMMEIEKGLVKVRWTAREREERESLEEGGEEIRDEIEEEVIENRRRKRLDMTLIRPTELPKNRRIALPEVSDRVLEAHLQQTKI